MEKSGESGDMKGEEYFTSYQDLDIHRLMLQDTVRTNAYKNAIYNAKCLFDGKVVMDVGAGTGILSLFCAKAGATRVIAVEASSLAKHLPKVIDQNGFKTVIEVIHSRVEDIRRTDCQVDIIVSEWMGFYLLHESMLESVIFARDNFLKKDGLMFPKSAEILAAPCKEVWKNDDFWLEEQYGFDLSCFSEVAKLKDKPEICTISADCLLSDPQLLWNLNLMEITCGELRCLKDRRFFSIEEDGDMQGVCFWFTCEFPTVMNNDDYASSSLSTAPWDLETHWKQTVVLFPSQTSFEAGDITGWDITLEKSLQSNSRSYKIHLEILDAEEEHPVPCMCGSVKCELVRHFMEKNPTILYKNVDSIATDSLQAN